MSGMLMSGVMDDANHAREGGRSAVLREKDVSHEQTVHPYVPGLSREKG
jgi:hypothetical protein